mmetsp:Transcript_22611/g.38743  ORF Transcript_22611/g.38743 Transcript_22611/m.38743 type:complete len:311 (+) Transcript_22611:509-1441(+)
MREERTSIPNVELVSSINLFERPDGLFDGSVAALRRLGLGESAGGSFWFSSSESSWSTRWVDVAAPAFEAAAVLTLSSIVCKALLNTVRHKLKRLSVNSFSIPSKPSSSDFIFSSVLSAMIISKIVSRMPNPALSSNNASTSSTSSPIDASSLAEPSKTTLLAIWAVSIPARRGSVNKTSDSKPSLRASTRSFLINDAAMFRAFSAFSDLSSAAPGTGVMGASPSVLRPAMGMAASSAENDGARRDGLDKLGEESGEPTGEGRKGLGRPMGDGLSIIGLPRGDMLGLARLGREGDMLGLARPGRPREARG